MLSLYVHSEVKALLYPAASAQSILQVVRIIFFETIVRYLTDNSKIVNKENTQLRGRKKWIQ